MLRKELKDGQHENWEQMMGNVCFAYLDIADNSFMPRRVHVNRLRPMFDSMIWRDEFCPDIEKEQENLLHEVDLESDTTLENRDNRPLAEGNMETSQLSKTDSDLQQANDDTIATERLNEDNTENDTLEITLLTSQPDPTIVTTDPTFTVQQERSKRIVRKPQRLIEE
ncbi:hypothetical protein OUZ56_014850 [Daphnia magna]|uniref:Uncharacterized protein n=1 Tax=Daphnia magna TaxID=35525 RepID=A0ABR0AL18_9CRUS|nr:hypothetical protein OUZ56_014850 [Daphnia magna]